jgi:hypothetical protein
LRWIGFDGSNDLYLRDIPFFDPLDWIIGLTKVFKGKPFISKPILSLLM